MKTAYWVVVLGGWVSATAVFGQALVGAVNELAAWPKNGPLLVEMADLKVNVLEEDRAGFNALQRNFGVEQLAGRIVHMSAEVRGEDILQGTRPYYGAKIQVDATTGKGPLNYGLPIPLGTFDWRRVERTDYYPADLQRAALSVGFQESAGTLWLRNFRVDVLGWPISIAAAANMGYVDDVAGDGQGGWADQGPENDARVLAPLLKALTYEGVPFMPEVGEKAVLVMRSPKFPAGLPAATVAVKAPGPARFLYVLHALSRGTPEGTAGVGMITVVGDAGRSQQFVVRENVDVGDWQEPQPVGNGRVVLKAQRADGGENGLYASKFALNADLGNICELRFIAQSERAVWIVAAVTASEMNFEMP